MMDCDPVKSSIIPCVRGPADGKPNLGSKFKFSGLDAGNPDCYNLFSDAFLSIRTDLSPLAITFLYVTKR